MSLNLLFSYNLQVNAHIKITPFWRKSSSSSIQKNHFSRGKQKSTDYR